MSKMHSLQPGAPASPVHVADCAQPLEAARRRVRGLIDSLEPATLLGPRLAIVNPPLWEVGHLGWFQERWMLRPRADGSLAPSSLAGADELYDSAQVAHGRRWSLPLPTLQATWDWLDSVMARSLRRLEADLRQAPDAAARSLSGAPPAPGAPGALGYFSRLCALHEQMHAEALGYSRQTLGYPPPDPGELGAPPAAPGAAVAGAGAADGDAADGDAAAGDAEIDGGEFFLGASPGSGFVFDNEKWAHRIVLRPFAMARRATTAGEFAAFVDDGGYHDARWWCADGWAWRQQAQARAPVYWRPLGSRQGWEHRWHDRWLPLQPGQAMLHVNAYEAAAWCRWAGRRLPTEAEWEFAAATVAGAGGLVGPARRYPWGEQPPDVQRACLWWASEPSSAAPLAADALPAGDSGRGCRQMIGNTWEWTASVFSPYPGFVADPYRDYSQPWFGTHRVLRGGSFATAAALVRNSWRNFYRPDRRDVYAGFRSCAQEGR